MKIIIAMDSFKGTLDSTEAGNIVKRSFLRVFPLADIEVMAVADGGEGTMRSIITNAKAEIKRLQVIGPLGGTVTASYAIIDKMAVIEMAQASGITLISREELNPLISTTYGTGQLIKKALDDGVRRIIIGIGGSATNDGGVGMAQALGVRFLDAGGSELGFGGASLAGLNRIDISCIDKRLEKCEILAACDVRNPLCGPEGASYVYGPQKGADEMQVKTLDRALCRLAEAVGDQLGLDYANIPGAGAAGGLGFGLMAFCNATLKSGIELILDLCGFKEKIESADLVITGEGCLDDQARNGKAPVGIAIMAKAYGIPVIAIAGQVKAEGDLLDTMGINAALACVNKIMKLDAIKEEAEKQLYFAGLNAARLIKIGQEI